MRIMNDDLLNGVAFTLNTNYTGDTQTMEHLIGCAIQLVWTGTPAGTFKLQASLDKTNWADVPSMTQAAGGAAGNLLWNVVDLMSPWVRVTYTFTSSTGTLTVARMNSKGI